MDSYGLTSGAFQKGYDFGGVNGEERQFRRSLMSTDDLTRKIGFCPMYMGEVEEYFSLPMANRIVLIQPVRIAGNEDPQYLIRFREEQARSGNGIYEPKRHNDQNEKTGGVVICNTMRHVIKNCERIAWDYSPSSEGSKVDYGMAFALSKRISILNKDENFDDVFFIRIANKKRDEKTNIKCKILDDKIYEYNSRVTKEKRPRIKFEYVQRPSNGIELPPMLTQETAIHFGMILASEKPFKVTNLKDVKRQVELEKSLKWPKSYSMTALALHDVYNR